MHTEIERSDKEIQRKKTLKNYSLFKRLINMRRWKQTNYVVCCSEDYSEGVGISEQEIEKYSRKRFMERIKSPKYSRK